MEGYWIKFREPLGIKKSLDLIYFSLKEKILKDTVGTCKIGRKWLLLFPYLKKDGGTYHQTG
jgi:hypothetical protein